MQSGKITFKSILHAKPVLVLGLFLLILFGYNVIQIIKKSYSVRKEKILAEERKFNLELQKRDLENSLLSIETDEGAEQVLREKFRIVKEQEGLIVIVDDAPKIVPVEKKSIQIRVKTFFKNLF